MRRSVTGRGKNVAAAIAMCAALIATQASRNSAQAATVTLSPGANIQAAVDANPSGTAFVLTTGVYRMQAVVPKGGDSFTGQAGADLNGSKVLSNWVKSGNYWTSAGAPALNSPYGSPTDYCNDPSTGCVYPQDLFFNSSPLVHKLALPISSGQWYFDYPNDVVYMADDPAGKTVELSVAQQAISGYVNNITVQNLLVEKYATPLNAGAIGPYYSNWIIKSNEVRLNHGGGIKAQYGHDNYEQILSNNVHDNGQQGIASGGGTGTLIQYNTISNNGYANVLDSTEEGGGKVSGTINVQVLNNTYSNNNGVGLWGDCGATGSIFSGNTITGNRLDGIRYEISHSGTISNNTLTNNAQYRGTGACTHGSREIVLTESDHTNVTNNTITSNCAGITMTQGTRNLAVLNSVVHNSLTFPSVTLALIQNVIGGWDPPPSTMFDPANQNYFDYNTYDFGSPTLLAQKNWQWGGSNVTWSGWQAAGEDTNGTAD